MSSEHPERVAVVEIDASDVASVLELHQRLSKVLGFPPFYGNNWDAFWDAITDLVPMPHRLVIRGWSVVATRWPEDAEKMLECLRDLNEQCPDRGCDVELLG